MKHVVLVGWIDNDNKREAWFTVSDVDHQQIKKLLEQGHKTDAAALLHRVGTRLEADFTISVDSF